MSIENLEDQISALVRSHLLETHKAVEVAVANAFRPLPRPRKKAPQRSQPVAPRRERAELLALQESVFALFAESQDDRGIVDEEKRRECNVFCVCGDFAQ